MLYIWSYLKKYPKWLALNLFSAVLFVIVNLGLPTILARMIDEGINRGDADKLYTYAWVMFGVVLTGIVGRVCDYFAWDCGTDYLVLRGWSTNDHHGPRYAQ